MLRCVALRCVAWRGVAKYERENAEVCVRERGGRGR